MNKSMHAFLHVCKPAYTYILYLKSVIGVTDNRANHSHMNEVLVKLNEVYSSIPTVTMRHESA